MLKTVALALGDEFLVRLVFVVGCTTALFITDEVTLEDVRATDDLIVDLTGYAAWAQLREQLRQKGFAESEQDAVICRMRFGDLKVDFMRDDAAILGFSNRWYALGIETAVTTALTDGLAIALHAQQVQQQGEARRAFDKRADRRAVEAKDQIRLPIRASDEAAISSSFPRLKGFRYPRDVIAYAGWVY
jgi:hypothetical protein